MELSECVKTLFVETARTLSGVARRVFMARTVKALGAGGSQQAERELGWNRGTIRKGVHELDSGLTCVDATSVRGRQRAEEHLPNLLNDIRAIVDSQSQTDPTFKTRGLYTRLSAAAVRAQLITQKQYTDEQLPDVRTVNSKLNELGYVLHPVAKCRPLKKVPETDAIFEQLHELNRDADARDDTLRLSLDATATVKIGKFSRGGVSRVAVAAADHDFKAKATLTPFGLVLPKFDDLFLYCTSSKVTSDFIVDCLEDVWFNQLQPRFPQVNRLVLNQDNGPENHSRRTQFMQRLIQFGMRAELTVRLVYYPPYHSKYNPIERCWGALEKHWNGALLDELSTVLNFAERMTWCGKHPIVKFVSQVYQTGVRLSQAAMRQLEKQLKRLPALPKWFVHIVPPMLTVSDD